MDRSEEADRDEVLVSSQVVGLMQHALVGHDLETGELLWRVPMSQGYDEHAAWPIVSGRELWMASPFQSGCDLYRLPIPPVSTVERLYQNDSMSNDVVSSVLVEGVVYGFHLAEAQAKTRRPSRGSFRAIDFATGAVRWSNGDPKMRRTDDFESNRKTQTIGHSSVVFADQKLYLLSDTGDLIMAKASPEQYSELGRMRILDGPTSWAVPAIDHGRLFVRDHHEIVAVYVGDQELLQESGNGKRMRLVDNWESWIGVRPGDAMQSPTAEVLVLWFIVTSAVQLASVIVSDLIRWGCPRNTSCRFRIALTAGLGCLVAGPVVSHFTDQFVFTWPGVLFVACMAAVYRVKVRRSDLSDSITMDRVALLCFVVASAAYFGVCQRLLLVSLWLFLCAFIVVIPGGIIARIGSRRKGRWVWGFEVFSWLVTSLCYWGAAGALIHLIYSATPTGG